MNINYDNIDLTNGVASSTNFMSWQPLAFFTNAADRLLRAYTTEWRNSNPTNFATTFYTVTSSNITSLDQWTNYPAFGIGHIPVLVSNQFVYSSAVNRLLQLAANMYDATTTNYYPSVFRPTFWVTNEFGNRNVYIDGYADVSQYSSMNLLQVGFPPLDTPVDVTSTSPALVPNARVNAYYGNVYGVPWIIGAKKGFPNFNKFAMQDVVQIERKLQIFKSVAGTLGPTNQMYIFSVSNSIGINCWNSYSNQYPNPVQLVIRDNLSMMLINDGGAKSVVFSTYPLPYPINATLPVTPTWPGSAWSKTFYASPAVNSFVTPINTTIQFMPSNVFYSGTTPPPVKGFYPSAPSLGWETNKTDFSIPNFGLLVTNRLQVFMLDGNHVIDYAQFAGPDSSRNLNAEFQTSVSARGYDYLWSTSSNTYNVPWGIVNQIDISDGQYNSLVPNSYWTDSEASDEMSGFGAFMGFGAANGSSTAQFYKTNNPAQVPYTPTVTTSEYISWQANDPLVHYLASDLNFQGTESGGPTTGITVTNTLLRPNYFWWNDRYQPWGRNSQMANTGGVDPNPANLAFKDPLVRMSDNWDFPKNKFPTVGWLGRVHRGTPWQTVYLKATNILAETTSTDSSYGTNTWMAWTGNFNITNVTYNAPVQDRLLFDLFTTAFNDNATRGTLSVNQNYLAAWSALFSGVVALSNSAPDSHLSLVPQYQYPPPSNSYVIIQPAGLAGSTSPLGRLVQGINNRRATFINADGLVGAFEHVGDILSVPQLTEQSPFLNWNDPVQQQNGISDEMMEWLPQQTMSLLRASASPRYVIYCYGQTLKPAPDSIVTSGGAYFGMITNYQIVSEIATRAVVRFNTTTTNVVTFTNGLNADGVYVTNWFTVPVVTNNNAVIESFNILPPD
jgi:hypothetical protein